MCIYQTPCPGRGTVPDTWAIPLTHIGVNTGLGGARRGETVVQSAKTEGQISQLILRFSGVFRASLKGAEKKTDSPETPFWTTVSPHDSFSAPLPRSDTCPQNRLSIKLRPSPPQKFEDFLLPHFGPVFRGGEQILRTIIVRTSGFL